MNEKIILHIEDNFHNRRIVRKILGAFSFSVIEAEDGLTGFNLVQEIRPPMILLDISLPGMGGMEVVRRIKSDPNLRHSPGVALTASAMRGDKERFLAAGCDDYLSKPVRAMELIDMVNTYYPVNA